MRTMTRFKNCKPGKWEQPVMHGYLQQCCDCALVHRMDFRVVKGRVQYRAWRAVGHTRQQRKQRGIVVR